MSQEMNKSRIVLLEKDKFLEDINEESEMKL
jgi:hypothetical protein